MSLLAVARAKGCCGATTAATALAAVWPRLALLVDADAAGGDLALRLADADGRPLARDRGLVSLAPALRTGAPAGGVWAHVQTVAGGLPVLAGVDSPAQAAGMAAAWPVLPGLLAGLPDVDVVADVGRLDLAAPNRPLLAAADMLLVLVGVSVEGLAHGRHAVRAAAELVAAGRRLAIVALGGTRAEPAVEPLEGLLAAGSIRVDHVGWLPADPAAAGLFAPWTRRLDRSRYVTAARVLAGELAVLTAAAPGRTPTEAATVLAGESPR